MDFTNVTKALTARGFKVSSFETAKEAAEYLNSQIDGATVGFGGSITLEELGLYALLSGHNTVFSHWHLPEGGDAAALRAQANPLEVTLIVGKSGISQTLLDEAVILLDSHELVKGRVLETAGLTAREVSDALCEALGAEGIACVGTKFVIWRKSEKLAQEKKKAAARKPAKKKPSGNDNPVKAGLRARKQAAEQQRKQRKQYFHDKAVSAAIERSRQQKEEQ